MMDCHNDDRPASLLESFQCTTHKQTDAQNKFFVCGRYCRMGIACFSFQRSIANIPIPL